jgi:hypothetical protein
MVGLVIRRANREPGRSSPCGRSPARRLCTELHHPHRVEPGAANRQIHRSSPAPRRGRVSGIRPVFQPSPVHWRCRPAPPPAVADPARPLQRPASARIQSVTIWLRGVISLTTRASIHSQYQRQRASQEMSANSKPGSRLSTAIIFAILALTTLSIPRTASSERRPPHSAQRTTACRIGRRRGRVCSIL